MKKMILWALLGAWLAAMGLAGCGQTGPLYLPKSAESPKAAQSLQGSQVKPLATPTSSIAVPTKSLASPDKSVNPNP